MSTPGGCPGVLKDIVKIEIPRVQKKGGISGFNLSFEKNEIEWFAPRGGAKVEKSHKHVTKGKLSLLCQFPSGFVYPGLSWEVYNKRKCLDWGGKHYFSFDVYNNSETNVALDVKLKSGANSPKQKYQVSVNIPAQSSKNVTISINDLAYHLDVRQISYINIFMDKPRKTVTLYFDNIHLN